VMSYQEVKLRDQAPDNSGPDKRNYA